MRVFKPFFRLFAGHPWRQGGAVFVVVAALYGWLQAQLSFRDPDSFYHAGLTLLTGHLGPIREFPWLPFTTLSQAFADQHFLYHLLLIPFIHFFDPLSGLRVATVLLGATAVTTFFLITRLLRLRHGWAFALILATSADLMFRLNLAKASALAITLLLLGFICALFGRRWLLFLIAWLYVWAHGSWPLLPFAVLVVAVVQSSVIFFRTPIDVRLSSRLKTALYSSESRQSWLAAALTSLGTIGGLIVNPFFPANLEFFWYQTIQVALVGLADKVDVGIEWYPYALSDLIRQNGVVFVLLGIVIALAVGVSIVGRRAWRSKVSDYGRNLVPLLTVGVISFALLVLTLKSRRHVEFLIPFALLLTAIEFDRLVRRVDLRRLISLLFSKKKRLGQVVAGYIIFTLLFLPIRDIFLVSKSLRTNTYNWSRFAAVGDWMRLHVPPESVIFNGDWADFPVLFYRFPEGRYIIGLDAGFLYLHDQARYDEWRLISAGQVSENVGERIEKFFGAHYVLVRQDQEPLLQSVEADSTLLPVYEDDEVRVFMRLESDFDL
ncbi:hypothetical protein A2480_03560 [Candidatus Uhrbacteria bacterium RIFOXYC2_FULL_47_19]|uniref:Glycosyltransferase RgtA/B/C/D-like domain-containing protein n=1 Tax=Candidatus Uhrbacteria bacterium RIFOXYC2_FULL_47_19 TaxID=1802424 RepID=A0A1F7WC05_9BACT|nr:MAG: hypothetical protein A2480_03560 [Candidatus Uhrbacteria bacterium RIFOXYC2_FULL_47_19]HCC21833.1 hypothetical protein [Candidatus Uhrbacteria bacterium]